MGRDEVDLFSVEERAVGDDRKAGTREPRGQRRDQPLDFGPVKKWFASPELNLFRGLCDPAIKLGEEVLDIGQLRDRGIGDLKGLAAIAAGIVA
jgi:hypothetical protein